MVIDGFDEPITVPVAGTGSWDKYVKKQIGKGMLGAGLQQIIVRPSVPPRSALIDLKEIRLVPVKM